MELRESFGETVRSIRRDKGLPQGAIGANQGYVSEVENGLKSPTLQKIVEIASNLGVHPITLLTVAFEKMGTQTADKLLADVASEINSLKSLRSPDNAK